ncbi:glycoside hydrolase family 16 protein [Streptacidiphilus fuscans]|uniref:GH16 domain-containing protein n=1 Tax=Streptacidiphilus fuscans TaxID=2789292 RepID=A0A931FCC5_9ACTN|nr:hypothetical protein [Streptacidiphilus fuscans]MBF9069587.1 hypothetical protein [Streptacidiphilus fuscans]
MQRKRLTTLCAAAVLPLLAVMASSRVTPSNAEASHVEASRVVASRTVAGQAAESRAVAAARPLRDDDWTLTFEDDFAGSSLNTALWQPGWFGTGITGPVNTQEAQGYDSRNVTVSDGHLALALTATHGALVSTNPHDGRASGGFEFTGPALMEALIYTPGSTTVSDWPAFWSDGQSFPGDGEIDVMEGLAGQLCFHVHQITGGPGQCTNLGPGWHNYAAYWNPSVRTVTFYYDGVLVGREAFDNGDAPQYLIIDNTSTAKPVPDTMLVDWVRVWQQPHYGHPHPLAAGPGRG